MSNKKRKKSKLQKAVKKAASLAHQKEMQYKFLLTLLKKKAPK